VSHSVLKNPQKNGVLIKKKEVPEKSNVEACVRDHLFGKEKDWGVGGGGGGRGGGGKVGTGGHREGNRLQSKSRK